MTLKLEFYAVYAGGWGNPFSEEGGEVWGKINGSRAGGSVGEMGCGEDTDAPEPQVARGCSSTVKFL